MNVNEITEKLKEDPMLMELMKLASEIDDQEAIREATKKLREAKENDK